MKQIKWIARDENGELYCYSKKPVRCLEVGEWIFNVVKESSDDEVDSYSISNTYFPELSWVDEPIKVEVTYKKSRR